MNFISKHGTQSRLYDVKQSFLSVEYVAWMDGGTHMALCDFVRENFEHHAIHHKTASEGIRFEQKGISWAFEINQLLEGVTVEVVLFVQLCLAQKLQEIGYIINLSEIKDHPNGDKSHIIYLKPSMRLPWVDNQVNQLYGNIHIEVKTNEDQLLFCKMLVHPYNDRNYHEHMPFSELINYITTDHPTH